MLNWTEEYSVSTLSKPDPESIEETTDAFKEAILLAMRRDEKFYGRIMIGRRQIQKRHDIEVGERKIPVCRLVWRIKGDKDLLEEFLHGWKEWDENPLRVFNVHREYTFDEFMELMLAGQKEKERDADEN